MPRVKWSNDLETGWEEIDREHREIISVTADIDKAVEQKLEAEVCEALFQDLSDYLSAHFSHEEKLMADSNYPGYEIQLKEHIFFASKIKELRSNMKTAGVHKTCDMTVSFLVKWFFIHIRKQDLELAQYLKGLKV